MVFCAFWNGEGGERAVEGREGVTGHFATSGIHFSHCLQRLWMMANCRIATVICSRKRCLLARTSTLCHVYNQFLRLSVTQVSTNASSRKLLEICSEQHSLCLARNLNRERKKERNQHFSKHFKGDL